MAAARSSSLITDPDTVSSSVDGSTGDVFFGRGLPPR
jgi:hypothetical protein